REPQLEVYGSTGLAGLRTGIQQRYHRRVDLVEVGVSRGVDPPHGAITGVLPERVVAPAFRKRRPGRGGPVRNPQRELPEARSPASAVLPPWPGPVDDRLLACLGLYLAAELGDPRPHRGLAEPVTMGTVRVVLEDRKR